MNYSRYRSSGTFLTKSILRGGAMKARFLILSLSTFLFVPMVQANIPPIYFQCSPNQADSTVYVQGTFKETPNRHGAGAIDFSGVAQLRGQTIQLSRQGDAQTWAVDNIEYSDRGPSESDGRTIELQLEDANYFNGNVSTLKLNTDSIEMTCRFTTPRPPSNPCYCCHHYCGH